MLFCCVYPNPVIDFELRRIVTQLDLDDVGKRFGFFHFSGSNHLPTLTNKGLQHALEPMAFFLKTGD
jgi:hypothetical protein